MARAVRPPEVVLPRLGWLPLVGPLCARVLPPRRHRGRVLSWQEFEPFKLAFSRVFTCSACGRQRKECECAPEVAAKDRPTDEEAAELLQRFVKAQGLPWLPLTALPGAVMDEVLAELFTSQTRANLPRRTSRRMDQRATGGTSSPLQEPGEHEESPAQEAGSESLETV